tara:strand:+ start:58 stop:486 length:429 start_codon:yes stop_codon:yes gene_type:complete
VKHLVGFFAGFLLVMAAEQALATQPHSAEVQDHYKNVIKQTPYQVEICTEKNVSGDKTGDTVLGAIIGGIIGQNVTKNTPDGAKAGAIIGGILGHQNSKAQAGTKTVCKYRTRYKESHETIYSHSTITFNYNGRTYKVRFQR